MPDPLPTRYVDRFAPMLADVAFSLGALEMLVVLVRVPAAGHLATALMLALAACGALAALSAPLVALAAIPKAPPRVVRIVAATVGLPLACAAFYLDATEYVRLYAELHALLGLGALVGATLLRFALLVRTRATRPTLAALAIAAVAAPFALHARHDVRAIATHRSTLLADAMWLTHRDIDSLPPLPAFAHRAADAAHPLAERPRLILLVTVDALRRDAALSPAYVALSTVRANSVQFLDARTVAAWTVPAMYGLFTARGPWRTQFTRTQFVGDTPVRYTGASRNPRRVWPLPLDDRADTLAAALHTAGYQTRTCASLPFFVRAAGMVRGFDGVDAGVYRQRNRDLRGTTSDLLTACGIAMIDAAAGQPLFLWLHYSDPHEPYARHAGIRLPDDSAASRYAGEVAFVDEHLRGLLLEVNRRVGLANTLIVLSADHGEEFGEHGGEFHGVTLYDEIERVPLMIVAPGIAPRSVTSAVSLLDVAPTILDLVGAPALPTAEGRSLAGAMLGEPLAAVPEFAETVRGGQGERSVVDGPWKLIYGTRAGTYELYDVNRDPGELDMVTDAHADVVARLAREMGVGER